MYFLYMFDIYDMLTESYGDSVPIAYTIINSIP